MNNTNDNSNNIITDISDNINTETNENNENNSITNLLQNIYNEAMVRGGEENINNNLNNHERLRFFFDNNNSLSSLFNDINPLLINSTSPSNENDFLNTINTMNNVNTMNFNIENVFQNLLDNIRNNSNNSNNLHNLDNIFQESFQNDTSKYKKVLSEIGQGQLTHSLFKDSSKNNTSCPIFFNEFKEDDEIIQLPCLHCFSPDAINKWLNEEGAHCPVCRYELESEEKKINNEENNNENNEENNEENNNENNEENYEDYED